MKGKKFAFDLQEECRRKTSRKLAATLLCRDFRFPTSLSAEQCTSDDVADTHAAMIPGGASVVDLTCGLGIDTFHLARKASKVTAIERDPLVAAAVAPNAVALGLDNVTAICADCADWLAGNPGVRFDVAFIDPARRGEGGKRVYGLHDCTPDVVELMPEISRHASRLIVKASPMLDITHLLRTEGLRPDRILAIGTRSECKELVLDFDFSRAAVCDDPVMTALTVGRREFSFHLSDDSPMRLTEPVEGGLIGEPWPSVMKIGGYNHLPGARLHPSTHLYMLSDGEAAEFPGNIYRITRVTPFSSSVLKQMARGQIEASVAVRNFPMTADELRKRLRARESATCRMFGVTAGSGRYLITVGPF
ncbi:MAG: class I SAM-dependent methyltransferase [Muribaculaceae bacterium]|nr:class I SAM-dependent methyltransferase [Muribaculaceae bacterium]